MLAAHSPLLQVSSIRNLLTTTTVLEIILGGLHELGRLANDNEGAFESFERLCGCEDRLR